MLVPGRPGRRESRRRHPGVPGQQALALRLCVPQGGVPKADSSPGSPGGPSSPRRMQSRSQEAPGSAARGGGRLATGRCPHQTLRAALPPSGWARVRIRRRAQHTAQSGITAAIRRRPRGSRPTPGRTSPSEAAPGATAALKQPLPYRPLTFSALTRGASQTSASRLRLSTGPRPLRSPGQPQPFGSPLQGARPHFRGPPHPQQSSLSSLGTRPPVSARPGTNLKSAPPEPNS
ncbi:hypothetical protein NDU88_002084 [Pleurodeles waltl]|uniref:Uncharacterized protein n=1 Tax=Pleurodeles waltl TaxID=8319 RepID=A0AAV7NCL2_PLEWA|nr:hypothetical protein NDU88_002084 [Pleurodeles waltl]